MSKRTALYRFSGPGGALLYVGISLRALARFAQHADAKDWWHQVTIIKLEWFDSWEEAEKQETKAIALEHPLYNKVAGHQAPGRGVTPNRIVRMGLEWDELGAVAGSRGRTGVIRQLLGWYLGYPGVEMPERPPAR